MIRCNGLSTQPPKLILERIPPEELPDYILSLHYQIVTDRALSHQNWFWNWIPPEVLPDYILSLHLCVSTSSLCEHLSSVWAPQICFSAKLCVSASAPWMLKALCESFRSLRIHCSVWAWSLRIHCPVWAWLLFVGMISLSVWALLCVGMISLFVWALLCVGMIALSVWACSVWAWLLCVSQGLNPRVYLISELLLIRNKCMRACILRKGSNVTTQVVINKKISD